MITKKNKIETETAQLTFEVKRVGSDCELWHGRSWGDGDQSVVVDTFTNDPNTPAMTENLTDMLIFNAMKKMGAQSYVNVTKELDPLKSRSAYRDIPIPPRVVKQLWLYKTWVQQVNFPSGYRDPQNFAFRRIDHSMPSSSVLNAYFKWFQEKKGVEAWNW